MTTKPPTNNGDAQVLEQVRVMFRDSVTFGPEVPPVALQAARTPGFGTDPIDERIRAFVTANYGHGWRVDRRPHLWEQGGGDDRLDQLFADEAAARVEFERVEGAMWLARDAVSAARQQEGGSSVEGVALATKGLQDAVTAWQESKKRLETRIGRRTTRQLVLQESFRRGQAAAR